MTPEGLGALAVVLVSREIAKFHGNKLAIGYGAELEIETSFI